MPFGIKQDDRFRLLIIGRLLTAAFRIGGTERTLDAVGGVGHLVLDCVTQKFGGDDDAGRDEREQERILDRLNGIFVRPEFFQKIPYPHHSLLLSNCLIC